MKHRPIYSYASSTHDFASFVTSCNSTVIAGKLQNSSSREEMLDDTVIQTLAGTALVFGVFIFLRWIKQNGVKDNGKTYPPSLPVLPVVGAILRGGMSVLPQHFMRAAEKIGPVFSFKIGTSLVVVLNGYDSIFDAMIRHAEAFADRPPICTETRVLNPELRGVAFTHYDEAYKKHYKIILSILKEFGFGAHRVSETRILQQVQSMNEEISKQNGRPIYPKWLLSFATSNVMISNLFGNDFLQSFPKEHTAIVKSSCACLEYMDMTLNMVPIVRFLPMFRKKIDCLRMYSKRLMNAIDVGIECIKSNQSEPTFVGRFLEIEGLDYDHQDLRFLVRDLVFGSTDTQSTTLQWALVELANHPQILNRIQREVDEMVPEDRLPSLDDKPRLTYTEAVILEVMRRRTVLPTFLSRATLKDTKVLGYDVPKSCMVIGNAYSAHMEPKFWKDPENFRPERFLDADNKIINSQRVIPFGLGKRSCLGETLGRQTVFLFLTSLVQRFNIRPPEGQKTINVTELSSLTMCPSYFEVRLIPRMKTTEKSSA